MRKPWVTFHKYSGSGNDFVCIDNRQGEFDRLFESLPQMEKAIRLMCHRGHGIGADGIISVDNPDGNTRPLARIRFFESNGKEVAFCGNGAACVTKYVLDRGIADGNELDILTSAGAIKGIPIDGDYVRISAPAPSGQRFDLSLATDARTFLCDFIIVGVPHVVTYVPDVDSVDVAYWGPRLRNHPALPSGGACVNFVQVVDTGRLAIRTFETGVESETLACGTGASASAILSSAREGWEAPAATATDPVLVRSRGGDILRVSFKPGGASFVEDLYLDTAVRLVYRGEVEDRFIHRLLARDGAPQRLSESLGLDSVDHLG